MKIAAYSYGKKFLNSIKNECLKNNNNLITIKRNFI